MWFDPDLWKNLTLVPLVTAIVYLGGCTNQPTDQQLEVWRKQAITRNAEIVADNLKKTQPSEWNLVIQGELTNDKSLKLDWQQVLALATTHVLTTDPNYPIQPDMVFDFRGVPISKLLKELGNLGKAREVTFVSYDAYQTTVSLEDLLNYPIILAIANNNQPINRAQGGPIYLVFPYKQYPQLKEKYDESSWAFYVTNVILGTERVQLQVGNRTLTLTDLDKLPQVTLTQTVGYRIGWPSGVVQLHGVRLRDVIPLGNVALPAQGEVVVQGKPPIYRSDHNPITIPVAEVRDCDVLLATRWGEEKQLIPARLGGP